MPIHRLNHAVLYVANINAAVEFYGSVLGFRKIEMLPEHFRGAAFMQAPGSTNDHDLGLFEVPDAGPSQAGRTTVGLYHLAWEVDTLQDLENLAKKLTEAGGLTGATDHGTTKSLYGQDPSGNQFEIAWIIPADLLTPDAIEARKEISRLDLEKEKSRYGADTLGGYGISRPVAPK